MFKVNVSEKGKYNGEYVIVSYGEDCETKFKVYHSGEVDQKVLDKTGKYLIKRKIENIDFNNPSNFDYGKDIVIEKEKTEKLIKVLLAFGKSYSELNKLVSEIDYDVLDEAGFAEDYPLVHSFDESNISSWVLNLVENLKVRI